MGFKRRKNKHQPRMGSAMCPQREETIFETKKPSLKLGLTPLSNRYHTNGSSPLDAGLLPLRCLCMRLKSCGSITYRVSSLTISLYPLHHGATLYLLTLYSAFQYTANSQTCKIKIHIFKAVPGT